MPRADGLSVVRQPRVPPKSNRFQPQEWLQYWSERPMLMRCAFESSRAHQSSLFEEPGQARRGSRIRASAQSRQRGDHRRLWCKMPFRRTVAIAPCLRVSRGVRRLSAGLEPGHVPLLEGAVDTVVLERYFVPEKRRIIGHGEGPFVVFQPEVSPAVKSLRFSGDSRSIDAWR